MRRFPKHRVDLRAVGDEHRRDPCIVVRAAKWSGVCPSIPRAFARAGFRARRSETGCASPAAMRGAKPNQVGIVRSDSSFCRRSSGGTIASSPSLTCST